MMWNSDFFFIFLISIRVETYSFMTKFWNRFEALYSYSELQNKNGLISIVHLWKEFCKLKNICNSQISVQCLAIISEEFENWHFSWPYNRWTTFLDKFWKNNNFCWTRIRTSRRWDEIISSEVKASRKV